VRHGPQTFFWRGGWQLARVEGVHPSRNLRKYRYSVRLGQTNVTLQKNAMRLRRQPAIALAHEQRHIPKDDDDELTPNPDGDKSVEQETRKELLKLRAAVVLTPTKIHTFQGYTAQYQQYWQVSRCFQHCVTCAQCHGVFASRLHCCAPQPSRFACRGFTAADIAPLLRGVPSAPIVP
jgi:hypothetical protein